MKNNGKRNWAWTAANEHRNIHRLLLSVAKRHLWKVSYYTTTRIPWYGWIHVRARVLIALGVAIWKTLTPLHPSISVLRWRAENSYPNPQCRVTHWAALAHTRTHTVYSCVCVRACVLCVRKQIMCIRLLCEQIYIGILMPGQWKFEQLVSMMNIEQWTRVLLWRKWLRGARRKSTEKIKSISIWFAPKMRFLHTFSGVFCSLFFSCSGGGFRFAGEDAEWKLQYSLRVKSKRIPSKFFVAAGKQVRKRYQQTNCAIYHDGIVDTNVRRYVCECGLWAVHSSGTGDFVFSQNLVFSEFCIISCVSCCRLYVCRSPFGKSTTTKSASHDKSWQ